MLNKHCPYCAFHQRCHAEAMAKDDLSLLRGLSAKDITQHHKHGIFTVTQLSCTFRPRKRRKPAPPKPPLHQAALQALAIRELEGQKLRISTYQIQARYELAAIYDRASNDKPKAKP